MNETLAYPAIRQIAPAPASGRSHTSLSDDREFAPSMASQKAMNKAVNLLFASIIHTFNRKAAVDFFIRRFRRWAQILKKEKSSAKISAICGYHKIICQQPQKNCDFASLRFMNYSGSMTGGIIFHYFWQIVWTHSRPPAATTRSARS